MASHSKQSLASTAYALLRRSGVDGTGLIELIKASGAPRGSIYHHFPGGKLEIIAAGLEIGRKEIGDALRACFAGPDATEAKVLRLFQGTARRMKADAESFGCPVAAVALDNFGNDRGIRAQCESILSDWREAIAAGLIDVKPARRAAVGALILATYEGALISARTAQDPTVLATIGSALAKSLDAG